MPACHICQSKKLHKFLSLGPIPGGRMEVWRLKGVEVFGVELLCRDGGR